MNSVLLGTLLLLAPDRRGDEILRRSVEAHGGLEAFRAVRSWHIVAERRLASPDQPPRETYEEYLLVDRAVMTLLIKQRPGSLLVFGHDGRRGFVVADGTRREDAGAEGEAYYRAHGEYYLRALPFKWTDPGVRAEYEGETAVAGRPAHLIRLSAESGVGVAWKDVWRAAIGKENDLLLEARLTHDRSRQRWMSPPQKGIARIDYRLSDVRPVGRLRLPFRMEYFSEGKKTGENSIQRFELDVHVDPALFQPERHAR